MSGSKEEGEGPLLGGEPALWAWGEVVRVYRTEERTAEWGPGPAVWLHKSRGQEAEWGWGVGGGAQSPYVTGHGRLR